MRPSFITAMRSPMASASCWSWVTNSAGVPVDRRMSTTSSRIRVRRFGSRLANGSSSSRSAGCRRERAGERDALSFTAGELVGVPLVVAGEADELQHLGGACRPVLGIADAESDVAGDGEVREQRVVLEDETDPSLFGRQRSSPVVDDVAGEFDAPAVGRVDSAEDAQQGRLAAAARTDEGEQFVLAEFERDVVDGDGRPEVLADVRRR